MEMICPSCEARYHVPPGAIGEKGRQVSCMNCGHSWHAYPPLVLGEEDSAQSPSAGLTWQGPGGVARPVPTNTGPIPSNPGVPEAPSMRAETAPSEQQSTALRQAPRLADGGGGEQQLRSNASRSEQLAEIREMLAEVQSEDRAAAAMRPDGGSDDEQSSLRLRAGGGSDQTLAAEAASAATAARQAQEAGRRIQERLREAEADDDAEDDDRFRAQSQRVQERARVTKQSDVKKLRRAHKRKVSQQKHAKAAGSGAFYTGLLLVAIIAAVMVGLYVLHPQIIERMPGTRDALTQYVATIDGLRVSIAETYTNVRVWITQKLDGA